jgi:hypothetical protein
MRRKGTDELKPLDGNESPDVMTTTGVGSGTADMLHVEHPEFLDPSVRQPLLHRLLDLVRRPFRD